MHTSFIVLFVLFNNDFLNCISSAWWNLPSTATKQTFVPLIPQAQIQQMSKYPHSSVL